VLQPARFRLSRPEVPREQTEIRPVQDVADGLPVFLRHDFVVGVNVTVIELLPLQISVLVLEEVPTHFRRVYLLEMREFEPLLVEYWFEFEEIPFLFLREVELWLCFLDVAGLLN